MGEVYRARDVKLGRDVALKVLPETFADDSERMARFRREARLLASVNHPNVAAIYGLEESSDNAALVLELVDGETLAQRLARGALPVPEALRLALQIAEALEAAHEKAIAHRDLKPANVKITPEGNVKVLDFGLAKAVESAPDVASSADSPTLDITQSRPGVILGTPAYMSPEQANGLHADTRSDIFSFGSVLYEMLAGQQAFAGHTMSEAVASVLAREPDFSRLPENLNHRALLLLRRCLAKNPKRRWQASGDLRMELETLLSESGGPSEESQSPPRKLSWKRAIPAVAAGFLCAGIASIAVWNLKPAPPKPVTMPFPLPLPEVQLLNLDRKAIDISPDGKQLAYVAGRRLYLKPMGVLQSTPIPETDDVANPTFSPDSRSLAFWSRAERTLKRVALNGGAPQVLSQPAQLDLPYGIGWGPNDDVVVGQGAKGIVRISNDGKVETLIAVKDGELAAMPQILPGGTAVLFVIADASITTVDRWNKARIVVQSLKPGSTPQTVIQNGSNARYIPTGHIVYGYAGTLQAAPFDLKRLKAGSPVTVVSDVRDTTFPTISYSQFSVSDNGSLAYVAGKAPSVAPRRLARVDLKGNSEWLDLPPGPYSTPRLSPDGKRLAFARDDGRNADIYVYELTGPGQQPRQLTDKGRNLRPIWSGDGERILYQSDRDGNRAIFWQRADGTGPAEPLTIPKPGLIHRPCSWTSSDQKTFVFIQTSEAPMPLGELFTFSFLSREPTLLIDKPKSNEDGCAFSRDGRWMAYHSDEGGSGYHIYVRSVETGDTFKISKGGIYPIWSPTESRLFYWSLPEGYASVDIQTEPFASRNFQQLPFAGFHVLTGDYDIFPTGDRFIMMTAPENTSSEPTELRIVVNWFDALLQSVTGK
jgi:serine/threonine-protein kinase